MVARRVTFWRLSCPFLRVILHVIVFLRCSESYRPDGNDNQQLSVVSKGAIVHGGSQSQKVKPSALEQSWATNSTAQDEQMHNRSSISRSGNPPGDAKCAGKGDGWKCAAAGNMAEGGDRETGAVCTVVCNDDANQIPADPKMSSPGVTCTAGKYNPEPECAQRVQCDTRGGGWYCGNYKNEKKINEGLECEVTCTEPDYIATIAKATCTKTGDQGVFQPEAGCREGKHCEAKGGEGEVAWECKGEEGGREEVKHGDTCEVLCSNASMVPQDSGYKCNDGNYTPAWPACGPPKDAATLRSPSLHVLFTLAAATATYAKRFEL